MREKQILIPRFAEMLIPSLTLMLLALLFAFTAATLDVAKVLCFVIAGISGVMLLLSLADFFLYGFAKEVPFFEPLLPIFAFGLGVVAASLFFFVPIEGTSSWRGLLMVFAIFFVIYDFYYAIRSYFRYYLHKARKATEEFVQDYFDQAQPKVEAKEEENPDVIEVEALDKEEEKK